jgi:hypothetical protein
MGVNKDIGKAYNERLKNLEATPDEHVWEKIQNTLETKKKTKIFPFWFRMVGAGLLILLLTGIGYKISVKNNSLPSTIEENENIPNNKTTTPLKSNEILISDSEISNKVDTENKKNGEITNYNSSDSIANSKQRINNKTLEKLNSINNGVDNLISSTKENNTLSKTKETNINNNSKDLITNSSINKLKNKTTYQDKINTINSEKSNSIINSNSISSENNTNSNSKENNVVLINNKISEGKKSINNSDNNVIEENNIAVSKNNISSNNLNVINSQNKIDLENKLVINLDSTFKKDTLLVVSKKDSIPKKKLPENNSEWEVGAYITPTYFGSLSKGSSLGEVLENNDTQTNITLSYRILGHFKLSDKLTLRTGFGNTKLSHTTINATSTDTNGELENLSSFTGISYDFIELSEIYTNDLLGTSTSVDFKQEFTYFEIPVELIYRIPKNKIEWKVFAGVSAFKLSKNKIIAESSEGSYYIGVANNLSKYSFSVNLGGGLDYKVSNKVNITAEPIFKYHINTFNRKAYNFKPISMGISIGATYKF